MSKAMRDMTVGEAALNPDGKTYSGVKLAQWLFEVSTGKPLSEEDAKGIVATAQAKAAARKKASA